MVVIRKKNNLLRLAPAVAGIIPTNYTFLLVRVKKTALTCCAFETPETHQWPKYKKRKMMVVCGTAVGRLVCVCVCTNIDQWRPPTWPSRFLHSWVCCWCCCKVALACLSRLSTSRWRSWTRLSLSTLCCCCSRVFSSSCCMRCSVI